MSDAQLGAQTILFPVLRRQDDSCPDGVLWPADHDFLSIQEKLSALLGVDSEYGPGGLGPARAHQPCKTNDFPFVKGKIHIPDHPARVQVTDLKHQPALVACDAGKLLFDFPAHHVGNDFIQGCILKIHGCYVLTVAHDGNPVHNGLQFFQAVGYVYNAASLFLQVVYDAEQVLNLPGRQRRGGFIHDKYPGMGGKGFCNLHHLLFGHRKVAHHLMGIQVDFELIQDCPGFSLHLLVGQYHALYLLPPQEHVLRYGEMPAHIQLLVYDCNPCLLGLLWIHVPILFPEYPDRAPIPCIDTAEHLHQGTFSSTVLSQKRHDLTGTQFKMHMVQCLYSRKTFADVLHGNNRFTHFQPPVLLCNQFSDLYSLIVL